jgi:hypothetical protein
MLAISSTKFNPDRSDYLEDYDEYQAKIEELGITPAEK